MARQCNIACTLCKTLMEREKFSSRLGFILISAGCAIGLGNVWRFPYITGQYGGAAFVLMYLVFLLILGLPIMTMEFAVGRGSQKSAAKSFAVLQPAGKHWGWYGYIAMAGNYLLMMFYTTVSGWILYYLYASATGSLAGKTPAQVGAFFGALLQNPATMIFYMALVTILCFGICSLGLKDGVERVTKVMMLLLLFVIIALAIRCVTLPGAEEGLRFYLIPDFERAMRHGLWEIVFAAMGQAFFTLSLGIGSMAIFGSYLSKERRLAGEAINVTILDTFVALMAGLIIFPACFAYGVKADSGPGLLFVTLPNVFNEMPGGSLWGALFFLFMSFAALSTVIAVFENIISFAIDLFGWSRKKASIVNCIALFFLSLPCLLGFNLLSGIQPLGDGSMILDLEDFILSNNILPLGSLIYLAFCVSNSGWGWENFLKEANIGKGLRFPQSSRFYLTYILPIIIFVIFIFGYINKFA